jgi:hemoglobin
MEGSKTLYTRVNETVDLARVVDVFHNRVIADPVLASFFQGIDIEKLRAHQVSFLTHALGGMTSYSGRNLGAAHAHLRIGRAEFHAVTDHLMNTLSDFGVADDLVGEIIDVLAVLQDEIVSHSEEHP